MRTGSTLVRVVPVRSGGRDIREPASSLVLDHVAGDDEALRRAHTLMVNGGMVHVLDEGGFLVRTHIVPSPRGGPWWYVVPRPLFWGLGGVFLLQGILGVATRGAGDIQFWSGLVTGVLGAGCLTLLLASRRRIRRLVASED